MSDIHAPTRARIRAIDWNSLHVTSDSRADAGMFRRRVPLIERVVGVFGRLHLKDNAR